MGWDIVLSALLEYAAKKQWRLLWWTTILLGAIPLCALWLWSIGLFG